MLLSIIGDGLQIISGCRLQYLRGLHRPRSSLLHLRVRYPLQFLLITSGILSFVPIILLHPHYHFICFPPTIPLPHSSVLSTRLNGCTMSRDHSAMSWATWGPLLMVTNDWLCGEEKRKRTAGRRTPVPTVFIICTHMKCETLSVFSTSESSAYWLSC